MIKDTFHKRYKEIRFYFPNYLGGAETIPQEIEVFFNQSVHIVTNDLFPIAKTSIPLLKIIHDTFIRELGINSFGEGYSYGEKIISYLQTPYDVWKIHDDISDFIKKKISLLEIIFSTIESILEEKQNRDLIEQFNQIVEELNYRFKEAKLFFYYRNQTINTYNDKLSDQNIYEPFWEIMKQEKYNVIDKDIKLAFQRFYSNQNDAAFYAMKALESCIKIISDELEVTTGQEKGAANYLDNLRSKKVKFIDIWEYESKKLLFKGIRNPLGHGSGNEDVISLKYYQEKCIIDLALVWIKSLITRLS